MTNMERLVRLLDVRGSVASPGHGGVLGVVGGDSLVVEGLAASGGNLDIASGSLELGVHLRRLEGDGLLVKNIDLLKRQTLGLVDEEVGEDGAAEAGGSPDPEHLGGEAGTSWALVDEVRGSVADTEVPEPVGRSAERHTLGTDAEREDLSADDPSSRTPSGGETGDVEADEGNESLLGGGVFVTEVSAEGSNDELTDGHVEGTTDEEPSTTSSLHEEERRNSHDDVDNVRGNGEQEWITGAGGVEELSAVVEDEVDTGELLPSLDKGTSQSAEPHLALATSEACGVTNGGVGPLEVVSGLDVSQLSTDEGIVNVGGVEASEGLGSLLWLVGTDEPSWRLGKNEKTSGQDDSESKLDTDGDEKGSPVAALLGGVFNDGCDQETNGDAPLVTRDNSTSNPSGSAFGLVHGDDGGDDTNTETSDDSTDREQGDGRGDHLKDDTDTEDDEGNLDTPSSTEEVGEGRTGQGTEEGTS